MELIGFETWPAFTEEWLGEWILRATDGMTRRNNSVTPMGDPGSDLDTAIGRAESWFDDHGIPPVFRLTELAPHDLMARLIERGYAETDTTKVMTRTADSAGFDQNVRVTALPTQQWRELLVAGRPQGSEYGRHFDQLSAMTSLPSGFAELAMDGSTRAIGQVTLSDGFAMIFNMKTDPEHRRSGYAARTLATLLAHASSEGAAEIMLQVQDDNLAAVSLYDQAGFTTRYEYRYYQR